MISKTRYVTIVGANKWDIAELHSVTNNVANAPEGLPAKGGRFWHRKWQGLRKWQKQLKICCVKGSGEEAKQEKT